MTEFTFTSGAPQVMRAVRQPLALKNVPYHITGVQSAYYPNETVCTTAFDQLGVPAGAVIAAIHDFVCVQPLIAGSGYQMSIAHDLERYLARSLTAGKPLSTTTAKYSPRLNEKADLAICTARNERIYFEVEFRPNVEKDLIKFQIGHNAGMLAAAVLILASDRNSINPGYTTMPEFAKFERVIREVSPQYPLLLLGLRGEHR